MFNVEINNSQDVSVNNPKNYITVTTNNIYKYQLTFDVIFFNSIATINGKLIYKLFVRPNLESDKYFENHSSAFLVGNLSKANFQLINSKGMTSLKGLDGADKISFFPTKIEKKDTGNLNKQKPLFYCLEIPAEKFCSGEINKIRFNATIHANDSQLSQNFQGIITIKDTKAIKKFKLNGKRFYINFLNCIEGYFNFVQNQKIPYGFYDMFSRFYDIKAEYNFKNDLYEDKYEITIKPTLNKTNFLNLDNYMKNYLLNELYNISNLNFLSLKSDFFLIKSGDYKLENFYNFKTISNKLIENRLDSILIKNYDYSSLNKLTQKVSKEQFGDNFGVFIPKTLKGEAMFHNDLKINDFEINMYNSVKPAVDYTKVFNDDITYISMFYQASIDIAYDSVKSLKVEKLKEYILDYEIENI